MFDTIVESTIIEAAVCSQSVVHSAVGGALDNTTSGVLLRVEKYPASDISTYKLNTKIIERFIIFISLYLTGLTSSW